MKKVAILIDGEWFRRGLSESLDAKLKHGVTADVMYRNAMLSIASDEEIFRIFYYDCPPYEGKETNPIDQSHIDFASQPKHKSRTRFIRELKGMNHIAVRLGTAKKRGWTLTDGYINRAIQTQQFGKPPIPPLASDVFVNLEQKGVDMRIGIDVATLSLKKIVDRIILISGDTDMIPAMKLARREGVQVVLIEIAQSPIHTELDEDTDLVRCITPVP